MYLLTNNRVNMYHGTVHTYMASVVPTGQGPGTGTKQNVKTSHPVATPSPHPSPPLPYHHHNQLSAGDRRRNARMQGCKDTRGTKRTATTNRSIRAGDSILLPDASNNTTRHYHLTDQDAMIIVLKFGKPTDSSNPLEIQQELQHLTDQL